MKIKKKKPQVSYFFILIYLFYIGSHRLIHSTFYKSNGYLDTIFSFFVFNGKYFQVIILTDVPLLIYTILTPRLKCTNTAWTGTISLPLFPHFVKNVCVDRPDSLSLPSCSQYDVTSQSLIICHHRTTVSVTAIQHRTLAQKKMFF